MINHNKTVLLSMDVEEWIHLDYFLSKNYLASYSVLDGVNEFSNILDNTKVKATFFILNEVLNDVLPYVKKLKENNHEIALHGNSHIRPILMKDEIYKKSIINAKNNIENQLNIKISGYRAPSFGLDNDKLDIIEELGFTYDSSKIGFKEHPLYGHISLEEYIKINEFVYEKDGLFEFEIGTFSFFKYNIPFTGGGYFRLIPWFILKRIIYKEIVKKEQPFIFYIHPYELSKIKIKYEKGMGIINYIRATIGKRSVKRKIVKLVKYFKKNDYDFMTFREYINEMRIDNENTNS